MNHILALKGALFMLDSAQAMNCDDDRTWYMLHFAIEEVLEEIAEEEEKIQ